MCIWGENKEKICKFYWLWITSSFPPKCFWGRASQIALPESMEEQAEQGRQCQGQSPGCHLRDAIWSHMCGTCHISHSHKALWCTPALCLQPSPRGRGECSSQTLETLFGDLINSTWGSWEPCSCAILIFHVSISYSPYGGALSCLHIAIKDLPLLSPAMIADSQGLQDLPTLLMFEVSCISCDAAAIRFAIVSLHSLSRPHTSERAVPELCSETFFWRLGASLDAPRSLYVLLTQQFCFFLVIYLLPCWAAMASAHLWFILLKPPVQGWMGLLCPFMQHPMRVCPLGESWLRGNGNGGWGLVFVPNWRSQRRAHRFQQHWHFCPLKQELLSPAPFSSARMWLCMPAFSLVTGRLWKQLVQAVLFPKLPGKLEASSSLLISANTASDELFEQHLFAWSWETWANCSYKVFQNSLPSSG